MNVSLIIPAAGLGKRFQESWENGKPCKKNAVSKLFFDFDGEPVLKKTLNAFCGIKQIKEILIPVSKEMLPAVRKWETFFCDKKIKWLTGGATRSESVWNALKKVSPQTDWVMVHDGARPLVSRDLIRKVLGAAKNRDGVILARKVIPTIKRADLQTLKIEKTVDRNVLFEAETPQLIRKKILVQAYKKNPNAFQATDEAGLLEFIDANIYVVPHADWNPKLTLANDLRLARALKRETKNMEIRTGIGFDTHRLVSGRKLFLGGVLLPFSKGLLGHSDGDALLHAIADAVLGAVGGGDIGEWFPPTDPKFKGIRSSEILKTILAEAAKLGWFPYHVDTNVILELPRLSPYKLKIRKKIAELMALSLEDVSVKARTREGLGPEGEGLAITCQAIVNLKRVPK